MPPRGKAAAERKHAKRRMLERFGIPVGDATLRDVVVAIQSGKAKFIERQSLRITVWEYLIHDVLTRIVYDKQRKEIVTILRPGDESQYGSY